MPVSKTGFLCRQALCCRYLGPRNHHNAPGNTDRPLVRPDSRTGRQRGTGIRRDILTDDDEIPAVRFQHLRAVMPVRAKSAVVLS